MARLACAAALFAALTAPLLTACEPDAPPEAAPPLRVGTVVVGRAEDSRALELTGEIVARSTSGLSFRDGGRLIERRVDVGDHVRAGEVLARLDPVQQKADLENAEAAVLAAEAAARQAQADFERQQALLAKGFTTQSNFDAAEKAVRTAGGTLEAARAAADIARTKLDYTELKADADGIVVARSGDVGEIAQPAKPVLTVALDGPRDAVLDVSEQLFLDTPSFGDLRVRLVADPSVTVSGRVREVSPTVETTTGTVRVKVDIGSPPSGMTLGAPVVVEVTVPSGAALRLPAGALTVSGDRPAVWIVDPAAGTASLRAVEVAAFTTDSVFVTEGVVPGDRVVTDGGKILAPGDKVEPIEEARQ